MESEHRLPGKECRLVGTFSSTNDQYVGPAGLFIVSIVAILSFLVCMTSGLFNTLRSLADQLIVIASDLCIVSNSGISVARDYTVALQPWR